MFNNIGSKIKTLAKVLFWLGLLAAIMVGVLEILQAVGNTNNETSEKVTGILVGVGIIVGGFVVSWLSNFLLFGFGELIDSNQKILQLLEKKEK